MDTPDNVVEEGKEATPGNIEDDEEATPNNIEEELSPVVLEDEELEEELDEDDELCPVEFEELEEDEFSPVVLDEQHVDELSMRISFFSSASGRGEGEYFRTIFSHGPALLLPEMDGNRGEIVQDFSKAPIRSVVHTSHFDTEINIMNISSRFTILF